MAFTVGTRWESWGVRWLWSAALTPILALAGVSQPRTAYAQFEFTRYARVSPSPGWSFFAGEFTGDSRDDLAAYHPSDGSVWVGRNRGADFDFRRYATVSPAAGWRFVAGDFTSDGLSDLAAYHPTDGIIWVGRNTGSSFTFTRYARVLASSDWTFTAGYFDGDEDLDLVGYYSGDGSLFIFENAGTRFDHSKAGTLNPAAGWTVLSGRFTRGERSDLVAFHPSNGIILVGRNQLSTLRSVNTPPSYRRPSGGSRLVVSAAMMRRIWSRIIRATELSGPRTTRARRSHSSRRANSRPPPSGASWRESSPATAGSMSPPIIRATGPSGLGRARRGQDPI